MSQRNRRFANLYAAPGQADRRTIVLLGIGGVAVVLAALLFISRSSESAGSQYDALHVLCKSCDQQFTMTAEAAARERAAAGNPRKPLKCPHCGKDSGETMTQCGRCAQWYLAAEDKAAGQRKCTRCGYDPDK